MTTLQPFFAHDSAGNLGQVHPRVRRWAQLARESDRPLMELLEPRLLLSTGPIEIGDVQGAVAHSLRFAESGYIVPQYGSPQPVTQDVTVFMTGGAADVAWDSDVQWTVANGIAVVSTAGVHMTTINLHDTAAKSSLAINVSPAPDSGISLSDPNVSSLRTSVEAITGTSVGKILAPQANLVGTGIDLSGAVSLCTLGDVASSAGLVFGGTATDKLTLTAGNVAASELTLPGIIKQLTVQSWTTPSDITAAAVMKVTCKGDLFGAKGDFAGNIVATTGDIGLVSIQGCLLGDLTAVQGNIGTVRSFGLSNEMTTSNITAEGQVGIVQVGMGQFQGAVHASTIGLISTSMGFCGTIQSQTSIGSVYGSLVGTIQAGTSIGSFSGLLSGSIQAGDSIGGVSLSGGGSATLTARNSIGSILIGPRLDFSDSPTGYDTYQFTTPGPGSVGSYTLRFAHYDKTPAILTIDLGSGTPLNTAATLGSIHSVGVDLMIQGTVPFDPDSVRSQVTTEEFLYTYDWDMSSSGYAVGRETSIGGQVFFDLTQAV